MRFRSSHLLSITALILAGFVPTSAIAGLVELDLNGTLPSGGTIVGSVSYDTTATDNNSNNNQGYFFLTAWDITVTPDAPDPGFHFQSGLSGHEGDVFRTFQSGVSWIQIRFNADDFSVNANLSLNFYDLELPVSPNVAPDFEDYGAFIPSLFGGGLRSEYRLDGGPGVEAFLNVESATASAVPEPSVLLGFLTAGSLGLLLLRRRRG